MTNARRFKFPWPRRKSVHQQLDEARQKVVEAQAEVVKLANQALEIERMQARLDKLGEER